MEVFPAIIPLAGRRVVVAGEGDAADAKARLFQTSPAEVVRVSIEAAGTSEVYRGARLAFIAVPGPDAAAAASAARAAGALVNVVDRPELCDFTTPALVDRGAVVAAIATAGHAPLLAAELRQALEAEWPEGLGRVAELMARVAPGLRAQVAEAGARRALLRSLLRGPAANAALAGDLANAQVLAEAAIAAAIDPAAPSLPRRLTLARAPAAADLLTLRLLRRLAEADEVVADAEVDPRVLDYARRDAVQVRLDVGAQGACCMSPGIELAVRLLGPSGDPHAEAAEAEAKGVEVERLDG